MVGEGPPLLMYAPGGFDATIEKWTSLGIYARIRLLEHLPKKYRCILFDRRETGHSGGRVEHITWAHYVAQGRGLLEHLKIRRAHLMGGCMGCCPVLAFAVAHPQMVASMVLWWPVGGVKYRIKGRQRFAEHLAFVAQNGLASVVSLVRGSSKSFAEDPRGGPWCAVIRNDADFAESYTRLHVRKYTQIVEGMARSLLDRDTAPGAEPEDLLKLETPALLIPGRDESHATSAARYLEECLPRSQYWDVLPAGQTEETAAPRLLEFLAGVG